MKRPTNLNRAWEALDAEYGILSAVDSKGVFIITADEIHLMREIRSDIKFEPRLLTHFDNRRQQPDLFLDNDISILPKQRGSYIIGKFDPFQKVKGFDDLDVVHVAPAELQSATPENRLNETMGLNYALATGILQQFTGQELRSTVGGRHAAGTWSYRIQSGNEEFELVAENPQIEVDGGYEGERSLVLVEAKNNVVWEFCLRQLYFPYRTWLNKVEKPVQSVFVAIDGDDFYLFEYVFPEPGLFQAELSKALHFIVDANTVTKSDLQELYSSTQCHDEPVGIPFPQANSPKTTMDVVDFIAENPGADKFDIAGFVGFTDRQSDYYCQSAAYFGFLQRNPNEHSRFELTAKGREFHAADERHRKMLFVKALMERVVFRRCFEVFNVVGEIPDEAETIRIMREEVELGEAVYKRRSSTVRNWIRWLKNIVTD